jgi:glycosyltransferase involved in cell wall biosynthesis
MRILHIRNIANVAFNLSIQQKKMGHEVVIFNITEDYTSEKVDVSLGLPRKYSRNDLFRRFKTISTNLLEVVQEGNFDVFHLHDAGIFPQNVEIPLFFKRKGKVVVHWHGSKLRRGFRKRTFGSRCADAEIVSTPDLLEFAPGAVWIPNCIPLHGLEKIDRDDEKIVIGHAPTNRKFKGTEYFIEAMDELKKEYPHVDFLLIENMPHRKTIELLQTCDILVDSVGYYDKRQSGWYGVLTNEVQQMEIPSCTWIKPGLEQFLLEPSGIVNVTRDNLKQKLEELILDESLRVKLGKIGKEYVNRVHNNENIAKKVLSIYDRI